jgi:hypothetical protein
MTSLVRIEVVAPFVANGLGISDQNRGDLTRRTQTGATRGCWFASRMWPIKPDPSPTAPLNAYQTGIKHRGTCTGC